MAINWYAGYGGYNNTGNFNNVLLVGSPNNSIASFTNISLDKARASGYGQGVGFEQIGDNQLNVYLSLVGVAVTDTGVFNYDQHYVSYGGTYDYFVKISQSVDGGQTYTQTYLSKDVSHGDTWNLAYASGWEQSTFKRNYQINFGENVTHLKVEIYGESATFPHSNIFTRQQIIKNFKPWSVRKSGIMKTLDRPSGMFQIRKSNNWVNKSEMLLDESNVSNKGVSRIRKSGTFKGQSKIGSN